LQVLADRNARIIKNEIELTKIQNEIGVMKKEAD
jgi:hypothetical protein